MMHKTVSLSEIWTNGAVASLLLCSITQTLSAVILLLSLYTCLILVFSQTKKVLTIRIDQRQDACERYEILGFLSDTPEECLKHLLCILRMGEHSGRGIAYKLISRQTATLNQYYVLTHYKTKTSFSSSLLRAGLVFPTTASIKIQNTFKNQMPCFLKPFGNAEEI